MRWCSSFLTVILTGVASSAAAQSTPVAVRPLNLCEAGVLVPLSADPQGVPGDRNRERALAIPSPNRSMYSATDLLTQLSDAHNRGDWEELRGRIELVLGKLCVFDEEQRRYLSPEGDFILFSWLGKGPLDAKTPATLFWALLGQDLSRFSNRLPGLGPKNAGKFYQVLLTDRPGSQLRTRVVSTPTPNPSLAEARDLFKGSATPLATAVESVALLAGASPKTTLPAGGMADLQKLANEQLPFLVAGKTVDLETLDEAVQSKRAAGLPKSADKTQRIIERLSMRTMAISSVNRQYPFSSLDDASNYLAYFAELELQQKIVNPPIAQVWVVKPDVERSTLEVAEKLEMPMTASEIGDVLTKSWNEMRHLDPTLEHLNSGIPALPGVLGTLAASKCQALDADDCRLLLHKELASKIDTMIGDDKPNEKRYEIVEGQLVASLKTLKPAEASTTITFRNEPSTKLSVAAVTGYISQPGFAGPPRDRIEIGGDGKPAAKRLPTTVAGVGALWSWKGFDGSSSEISGRERFRAFLGLAASPHAGALLGGSYTISRGFTLTVGVAFLGMQARTRSEEDPKIDRVIGTSAFYGLTFGTR